ncbi:MAG TPA: helix-turn-helix transcriptional regulator [Verrucomicrobiota bacterium]|nr:helix-turn-helix transcriptional regulator [Verrucomicrobiota bacterium]HQL80045.1 helix-turn-helix transcriptional regulator [Verrucomicrobiota bacterium]
MKTIRESINWSQASFAYQVGITRNCLASIECGRTPLRYSIAWRIRDSFGVSLRWLGENQNFPDNLGQDSLPSPDATGLPPRALLSAVIAKYPALGEDTLEVGPLESSDQIKSKPEAQVIRPSGTFLPVGALEAVLAGEEGKTRKTDPRHRAVYAEILKGHVDYWIAQIPLGRVEQFCDKIVHAADVLMRNLPREPKAAVEARRQQLALERMKVAIARRSILDSQAKKKLLPRVTPERNVSAMTEMQDLIARLRKATSQRSKKAELSKHLGVAKARISEWLRRVKPVTPSGETTLRLLQWVQQQERKQKAPGSATNTAKGKTQVHKSNENEKANSNPKKR